MRGATGAKAFPQGNAGLPDSNGTVPRERNAGIRRNLHKGLCFHEPRKYISGASVDHTNGT